MGLRDGGFLLLGKIGDDKALVQSPLSPQPALMTRAEFEAVWNGQLVLMPRRASFADLSRRFDITWFLGAIHKYRRLLGEVLVGSGEYKNITAKNTTVKNRSMTRVSAELVRKFRMFSSSRTRATESPTRLAWK